MTTVLIVEDDRAIRESLAELLEVEGYAVVRASDGIEGLAEARHSHPNVILLDLMMPRMDGWQFRREQMSDPSLADIPVVVLSAFARRGDVDAAAYIQKPCSLDDVLDAVVRYQGA